MGDLLLTNLLKRLKAVVNAARLTWLEGYDWTYREQKELPFAWPALRQEKPQWKMIDTSAFIREGFTLNALIYSCVMYKVRATIPARLCAWTGDPELPTKLPPEHPLSVRVARPNSYQSFTEFQSLNIVYLNICGDVFIYKDPADGEMHSLRPDRVAIVPGGGRPAGIKGFVYVPEGGTVESGVPMLYEDVMHIKLPNAGDPLEGLGFGLSPVAPGAQSGDVDNMVTGFLNTFWKSGALLTAVLKFEASLNPGKVEEIRARFKEVYGGYEKWGVGVLDRGGDYKRIGLTFDEMGFETLDERDECRILGPFGIPPILVGSRIGIARGGAYSNPAQAREMCWEDTLYPELLLFEGEYKQHLDAEGAFVGYDLSRIPALQNKIPALSRAAFTLWQMGVPANQATRAVGLRLGDIPGGDTPCPRVTGGGFFPSGGGPELSQESPELDAEASTTRRDAQRLGGE